MFALAIDPLLRWHIAQRFFASARIFAFADDIAFALNNVRAQLPQVAAALEAWAAVSGLRLEPQKCVFLPVWTADAYAESEEFISECPAFAGAMVRKSARYLGIELGIASHDTQWEPVIAKAIQRAREVALAGASLPARIVLFNIHVGSLFLFKGRFCAPNRKALRGIVGQHKSLRQPRGWPTPQICSTACLESGSGRTCWTSTRAYRRRGTPLL